MWQKQPQVGRHIACTPFVNLVFLVPRGHAPFGQHQESRLLAGTTFRVRLNVGLNGFVNIIDWDQNQSDLSHLTLSMRRVTGSPWIADFRCWTWPVARGPTEVCQRSRFLVLTKRSAASGDENGTIFLRTKAICSKRMRRLISFRVNYILGKRYISYTIIHER